MPVVAVDRVEGFVVDAVEAEGLGCRSSVALWWGCPPLGVVVSSRRGQQAPVRLLPRVDVDVDAGLNVGGRFPSLCRPGSRRRHADDRWGSA